jgi:hypothetical protein
LGRKLACEILLIPDMKSVRLFILVISTGFIFFYYSEQLFWARVRPGDSISEWLSTWAAYSLMAFVFLVLVQYFRVRSIWALFLVGAAFGWIAEGVVVQTTYESLPLSISFTGLAWHALITVLVGWYAVRKSLHSTNRLATLKIAAAIGLCYGLWSISWWGEPDGGVSTVLEFAAFSFIVAVLAIFAYRFSDWNSAVTFTPNRWSIVIIGGLALLYFIFVTIPAQPLAALILPVLLSLVYLGLRWNRQSEPEGSLLDSVNGLVPAWKYACVLAIPVCAVGVYALATVLDLHWRTNWILYLVTMPLGFILFGVSLYKTWKKKTSLMST